MQQLQAIALTLQPQHQCSLQRSRCSGTTKDGGMPNRSTTHRDVSPRERLQRGMQPSLTHAKPTRKHTLATGCGDGMGKHSNLWFAMQLTMPLCSRLARPDHRAIVLISLSSPRSKRSRNATLTILHILLVRAHRLCIVGDGVTNRLDVPSKGHPQSLAALVTGRVFLPGRLPEGSVRREAKASVMQAVSGKITQARLPRV